MTPSLDLLRALAFVGLPVGLALGLALGLVANRADGWGGYGSWRRRAARLGHVAAIMLPALGGVEALLLGAVGAPESASLAAGVLLWAGGTVAMPVVLFLAAWRPQFRYALPLPAVALVVAGVLLALASGVLS